MTIFDHLGDTLFRLSNFSLNNQNNGWDGKSALKDTTAEYYYKIQGITTQGNHLGVYGNVFILTCVPDCVKIDTLKFNSQFDGNGYNPDLPSEETLPACH